MDALIEIDGARGEGGGQILRSSLSLSLISGRPVRLFDIRKGRSKPGLAQQHLTSVRAAAAIGQAAVTGDQIASTEVVFRPHRLVGGRYRFDVGTAGSATLVLQTLIPALLAAEKPSEVEVIGGTHNPWAPTWDFLDRVFFPRLRAMGAKIEGSMSRAGFFPKGGGRVRVAIEPGPLRPLALLDRPAVIRKEIRAVVAGLSRSIAEREGEAARRRLSWIQDQVKIEELPERHGPGNVLIIEVGWDGGGELISAIGERGKSAEVVAEEAATETLDFLAAEVPVGQHLADQLILPLAMAGGGSFTTVALTEHTRTQAETVGIFMPCRVQFEDLGSGRWRVDVHRSPSASR